MSEKKTAVAVRGGRSVKKAQPSPLESQSARLIEIIAEAASNPAVDIDKMDRLLQMKREVEADAARAAFNEAMADMQPNLPVIEERGKADRYTYARWEDAMGVVLPIISQYGFSLNFETRTGDGVAHVTAILRHRQGHEARSEINQPYDASGNKNTPQSIGSATSYGKRYTAFALLNLTSSAPEDDDGRAAGLVAISEKQFEELNELLDKEGVDKEKFCRRYQIESLRELPANKVELVRAELENRRLQLRLIEKGNRDD